MPIAGRTETRESVGPIEPTRQGKSAARTGAVISILVGLFLLFGSVTKLLRLPPVVAATVQLGFPAGTVPVIGGLLLFSLALYVVPRTSVIGAILITAYLGGAVCTNLRVEAALFTYILVPVYTAAPVWLGLYLRSPRLRDLIRAGH
jgi:hypothetical protein